MLLVIVSVPAETARPYLTLTTDWIMMKLIVEFLGPSRRLAQTRETTLEVADQATFRDVLCQLATRYPALVGTIILPPTFEISPAFMLNIDGRQAVDDLTAHPAEGQHLIIMVMEAGG